MRVLLVEDNPGDARLVQEMAWEAGCSECELVHKERLGDAIEWLAGNDCDLVLLDLSLPDSCALDTVVRIRAAAPTKPIVVLTGLDDEAMAIAALKQGAQDYLVKGKFDSQLLVRTARYSVERKRYEQELERTCLELERLNELKNRFLGMAAHDLRNPLTVILTASDFLLSDTAAQLSPEKRTEFLQRIRSNGEFMVRLIDDLLDVAQIESGEFSLRLQTVDLEALLAANVEQNRLLAGAKGIEISLNQNGGIPRLNVDPERIERVLNNLIGNAVKFSPVGAVVSVSARTENGSVVVSVADNGPGIPAEELDRLFKPFQRGRASSTCRERGTGLGLSISRKIVEAHRGRIWVESQPGKGSVFSFALPVEPKSQ